MIALLIGSPARFHTYLPDTHFAHITEKICVTMADVEAGLSPAARNAQLLAADAIAPVTSKLIAVMPNLKIIHSEGVGYNKFDLEAARRRGICVCNCKGCNAAAVAEQAILLMLGLTRTVITGHRAVLEGRQFQMKERRMVEGISELSDCAVGLVGFGDIGKATARLLHAFGSQIYYSTPTPKPPELELEYHARWLPLAELLRTCDIISLHLPVTEKTTGMVNAEFLSAMKPTAYLINTSRGELVDNIALRRALMDGTVAGAGLDTIAPEPVTADNPLVTLPPEVLDRVVYAPHLGGNSSASFRRAHSIIWQNFQAVAEGRRPENIVNGV